MRNHVLTGFGLTATKKNVHVAAFNQQMPLFTKRAGGWGGKGQLLRCPNGHVAIGVAANNASSGYRQVRFFGLLCAPLLKVQQGDMTPTHVVHGEYYDEEQRRRRGARLRPYRYFPWPRCTQQAICRTSYALRRVRLYSGGLVDRIRDIGCRSVTRHSTLLSRRSVNVGGPGGTLQTLDSKKYTTNATIDGMYVRSAGSLDQVSFHCRDDITKR